MISLDKTGEILKEFKSNYEKEYNYIETLRLEGNPKERDIARARNFLIGEWRKTHTDWALFVNSDVILPKDALEILPQKAKDESADIVCMPYAENPEDLHKPFEKTLTYTLVTRSSLKGH
ncbi:MAG: glycosyltransferase [Nitrososphaerales archaeon]